MAIVMPALWMQRVCGLVVRVGGRFSYGYASLNARKGFCGLVVRVGGRSIFVSLISLCQSDAFMPASMRSKRFAAS